MAQTIHTEIQKRLSDIDPFRHVNNVSQQMYFDLGKVEYYDTVLRDNVLTGALRIITASTTTSYLEQLRMDDNIYVTTTAGKIGNKSITLQQTIIRRNNDGGETVLTESTSVMVAFDFEAQTSVPVPDRWRSRMLLD